MKKLILILIMFSNIILNGQSQKVEITVKESGYKIPDLSPSEAKIKARSEQAARTSEALRNIDLSGLYKKQYEEVGGGLKFYGDGKYRIIELGASGLVSRKKLRATIIKKIDNICLEEKCEYEIFKEDSRKQSAGTLPFYEIHFTLKNDKNEYVTIQKVQENDKNSAKKKLLELNELKKQGIITQEEYDKAAAPHKKILLGL